MTAQFPHNTPYVQVSEQSDTNREAGQKFAPQQELLEAAAYWNRDAQPSHLLRSFAALALVLVFGVVSYWLNMPVVFWSGLALAAAYRFISSKNRSSKTH
ncbi:hypothetical protein [Paenibacillus thalictri]|uniref:Uncharacterized protein n=1 Tax=Paenibacillus thalictri TaxID=2527873 RepID=A0A4Q9DWI9_9BACL|nr:hypothetical protein [Paenibacillus thalictri]TBL79531.1 hypothetical protein EYB31_11535 [Paenibacillus thalictri]